MTLMQGENISIQYKILNSFHTSLGKELLSCYDLIQLETLWYLPET